MFAAERGKPSGTFGKSHAVRAVDHALCRPVSTIGAGTNARPMYVSFVSKAILWERGLCSSVHNDHSVPHHGPFLCPRFLSHMKVRPEALKPPCFLSSKAKLLSPGQEKPNTHSLTARKTQKPEGIKRNRRYEDFHHDPVTRPSASPVAPCPSLSSITPLPKIKPKSSSRSTPSSEKPQDDDVSTTPLQTLSPAVEDTEFKEAEAALTNTNNTNLLINLCPTEQEPPQSPASLSQGSLSALSRSTSLSHGSLSALSRSTNLSQGSLSALSRSTNLSQGSLSALSRSTNLSQGSLSGLSRSTNLSQNSLSQGSLSPLSGPTSLFSRSLDLSGRSSILSDKDIDEYQRMSPEGVISSPPGHSSPVAPCHASIPLCAPTDLATSALISTKLNGQTKAPSRPQTSPVSLSEPEGDKANAQESPSQEVQAEFSDIMTPRSGRSSTCPSPLMPSANTSSVRLSPSSSVHRLGSVWPVLPPISTVQEWCNNAVCGSSDVSCSQSQVFDELDALAPLSVSSSSMGRLSESSCTASKDTEVSPGLAALTVGCDSGNLGSLSRVQLLLLNRQEPDAARPFSLDEDLLSLDNYANLEMDNGVWRSLTAGSISEKCGSVGKAHQNKTDDLEECSGSPCSWIIDPSPSYNMLRSSDEQCISCLGSSEDEEAPSDTQSNYSSLNEEDEDTCSTILRIEADGFRKREERKTKALKMLSKLQDESPHQAASSKDHSNFEDFDFLAKYCIFNQEKLAEYKRVFEEEDTDGDGYISCLQVLVALKCIIPPELLTEEEEIYVYKILEMVDFRVTNGLVDLRLFAVIASLAQKIATMDDFMRSLISRTDLCSLEVKLFKAKKLFLFLLEEQADDGTSQQKYISPEQLILELKAGGICLEQEAAVRVELQHIPPLDLLDFLAYLPLFMLIHRSVIDNPLDDVCHL